MQATRPNSKGGAPHLSATVEYLAMSSMFWPDVASRLKPPRSHSWGLVERMKPFDGAG